MSFAASGDVSSNDRRSQAANEHTLTPRVSLGFGELFAMACAPGTPRRCAKPERPPKRWSDGSRPMATRRRKCSWRLNERSSADPPQLRPFLSDRALTNDHEPRSSTYDHVFAWFLDDYFRVE